MARASVAAQRRRARSSSTGFRLVYFVLMARTVVFRTQAMLRVGDRNWIGYSGETPKSRIGANIFGDSGVYSGMQGEAMAQVSGLAEAARGTETTEVTMF